MYIAFGSGFGTYLQTIRACSCCGIRLSLSGPIQRLYINLRQGTHILGSGNGARACHNYYAPSHSRADLSWHGLYRRCHTGRRLYRHDTINLGNHSGRSCGHISRRNGIFPHSRRTGTALPFIGLPAVSMRKRSPRNSSCIHCGSHRLFSDITLLIPLAYDTTLRHNIPDPHDSLGYSMHGCTDANRTPRS